MDIGDLNYSTPSHILNPPPISSSSLPIDTSSLKEDSTKIPTKRTQTLLRQLYSSSLFSDPLIVELENRIEKLFNFARYQKTVEQISKFLEKSKKITTNNIKEKEYSIEKSKVAAVEDPSEPSNQFVNISRKLQSDKSLGGYSNFKEASRSRTSSYSHGHRGEQHFMETIFDSKTLLAVSAVGLAFAFFPSFSPVPRSLFGRTWPHLLQLAVAGLIHLRKNQDIQSNEPRSNSILYGATAIIQLFTALRDIRGHSLVSFTSRALFGPIAPLVGLIKNIIVAIPNFLLKTVLLSGISMLGRVTIFLTISIAIVVAIGVLIVTAAENL